MGRVSAPFCCNFLFLSVDFFAELCYNLFIVQKRRTGILLKTANYCKIM